MAANRHPRRPALSRRQFLAAAGAAALFGGCQTVPRRTATRRDGRPNVVIIYTDDQGTLDLRSYGSADLATPHMDRLVHEGVRFTQFYAPAPVCSPSRAGLLTGRYPVRAGVPGNISSQPGHAGMAPAQVTMAETFRAAGYATAHIGKWHLGYSPETMPNAQGFDHSFGHMGGCIDNYSHFFYWSGPNQHDLWRNGERVRECGAFFPDLMAREAEAFIAAHRDHPFFMYFAMNAPHYPYQGEADWLDHYREAGTPYPRDRYAAFLSTQDERIGRLLDALDAHGLADDTIVVLQSDHGHSREVRAHGGGGNAGPYRGAKFSLFEGGIRVPAVVRWPERLPAGAVREQVGHGCDWLPTLAAWCGVPLIEPDIDGCDLRAAIEDDAPAPARVLHWTHRDQWAVREGDWKLIANPRDPERPAPLPPGETWFLANLKRDPAEQTNFAADHPQAVERLRALHDAWAAAAGYE